MLFSSAATQGVIALCLTCITAKPISTGSDASLLLSPSTSSCMAFNGTMGGPQCAELGFTPEELLLYNFIDTMNTITRAAKEGVWLNMELFYAKADLIFDHNQQVVRLTNERGELYNGRTWQVGREVDGLIITTSDYTIPAPGPNERRLNMEEFARDHKKIVKIADAYNAGARKAAAASPAVTLDPTLTIVNLQNRPGGSPWQYFYKFSHGNFVVYVGTQNGVAYLP